MTPLHPTEPIQVALCNGWKGAKPEAADFKHGLPLSAVSGNSWAEFKPARIGPIQPVDAGSGREDSARRAELGLGNASAGRGQCQITAAETERFFPYGWTEPRHIAPSRTRYGL